MVVFIVQYLPYPTIVIFDLGDIAKYKFSLTSIVITLPKCSQPEKFPCSECLSPRSLNTADEPPIA